MSHSVNIEFDENELLPLLFGEHNHNLRYLEEKLDVVIGDRANILSISGTKESVDTAKFILGKLWNKLHNVSHNKQAIEKADIDAELRFIEDNPASTLESQNNNYTQQNKEKTMNTSPTDTNGKMPIIQTKKKSISARSPTQAEYMKTIDNNDMVFGLGPAGTGKTYLAVAKGVSLFLNGSVERLIFCRPAIEAGERLGFLPGDMKEKIDPYLQPIHDALNDMLSSDFIAKKKESGEIEIAPLAFMRGRTLSNAFVVLDEAQNTTPMQMKMFLTRMGEETKMVITGDLSQTDLPPGMLSGLQEASDILSNVDGISFIRFKTSDIVRNPLVEKIVRAYDRKPIT